MKKLQNALAGVCAQSVLAPGVPAHFVAVVLVQEYADADGVLEQGRYQLLVYADVQYGGEFVGGGAAVSALEKSVVLEHTPQHILAVYVKGFGPVFCKYNFSTDRVYWQAHSFHNQGCFKFSKTIQKVCLCKNNVFTKCSPGWHPPAPGHR
jgi:hypothetical protein